MNEKKKLIIGLSIAFGGAFVHGMSWVLVRKGTSDYASPIAGTAVSLFFGMLMLTIIAMMQPDVHLIQKRKEVGFLMLSGACIGVAMTASFYALSLAPVVVIAPIQSSYPLFTALVSHFFRLEKVTSRLVIGTILVVVGIVFITIGRGS